MSGGNGHRPVNVVRGLLSSFGQPNPPRGPFNGAQVVRALEAEGWMPEQAMASDEWMVWRRADGRVLMNPEWEAFWEDDSIFRCLCRDMALTPDELVTLLESPQ